MRSLVGVQFYLLVLYLVSSSNAESSEDGNPKRSKLSSLYALTPSLRVGRRSEGTWNIHLPNKPQPAVPVRLPNEFEQYKRRIARMMAFPNGEQGRRSWGLSDEDFPAMTKRTGQQTANAGMWFGPRLGRVQKREAVGVEDLPPIAYVILDGGLMSRQVHYTPRLGRESEEEGEAEVDPLA